MIQSPVYTTQPQPIMAPKAMTRTSQALRTLSKSDFFVAIFHTPSIIFKTHFDERFDEFRRLFPAQDAAVDQQVAVVTVAAISAGDLFIPAMEGIVIIPDDFCRMAFG